MVKRLSAIVLFGGLLGLIPTAATAAPAPPAQVTETPVQPAGTFGLTDHRDDDHYRCMYRCRERDRYRRHYHRPRSCWYRDRWGWYRAPCRRHHQGHHGGGWGDGHGHDHDSHATGGYDAHRRHPRG